MIKRRIVKSTHQINNIHTCRNTHLDLTPAITWSDVQLTSPFRYVSKGSLWGPLTLSDQSLDCFIGGHLNTHKTTASVLDLHDTSKGYHAQAIVTLSISFQQGCTWERIFLWQVSYRVVISWRSWLTGRTRRAGDTDSWWQHIGITWNR